jgi:hypothetical protein
MNMPKAIAVCIGLNSVDAGHYQGWSGPLTACEADADDMAQIASGKGMTVTKLLTKKATRDAVRKAIGSAARALTAGDLFMLSYSGHGGQVPDQNGDEDDQMDETWCLYDGQLIDDELYALYGSFAKGVRILVFSDSCHSGTVARAALASAAAMARTPTGEAPRYRVMPASVALRVYRANKGFYDGLAKEAKSASDLEKLAATVLLISGCQDNQLSQDGTFNGLFTGQLLKVWNEGKFKKDYRKFHANILEDMPPDQSPNYFLIGAANKTFEKQIPFTV